MRASYRITIISCLLCSVLGITFSSANAQIDDIAYTSGEISFHYQQWPFGSYSGDFVAAGDALGLDGELPPGQNEAVGGMMIAMEGDTTATMIYGVSRNPDLTLDIGVVFIRTVGALVPGNYPIDPTTFMALNGFLDNVSNFSIPDQMDPASIQAWLDALIADHKFVSSTGSISVAEAGSDVLTGTFDGTMIDPETLLIISISNGSFSLARGTLPVGDIELPTPVNTVRAYPNPFNPQTTIAFSLAESAPVKIEVFDPAGHRVRLLFSGSLPMGRHSCQWDGTDDSGERIAGGLYLFRISTPHGGRTGKVLLTP